MAIVANAPPEAQVLEAHRQLAAHLQPVLKEALTIHLLMVALVLVDTVLDLLQQNMVPAVEEVGTAGVVHRMLVPEVVVQVTLVHQI